MKWRSAAKQRAGSKHYCLVVGESPTTAALLAASASRAPFMTSGRRRSSSSRSRRIPLASSKRTPPPPSSSPPKLVAADEQTSRRTLLRSACLGGLGGDNREASPRPLVAACQSAAKPARDGRNKGSSLGHCQLVQPARTTDGPQLARAEVAAAAAAAANETYYHNNKIGENFIFLSFGAVVVGVFTAAAVVAAAAGVVGFVSANSSV